MGNKISRWLYHNKNWLNLDLYRIWIIYGGAPSHFYLAKSRRWSSIIEFRLRCEFGLGILCLHGMEFSGLCCGRDPRSKTEYFAIHAIGNSLCHGALCFIELCVFVFYSYGCYSGASGSGLHFRYSNIW